MSDQINKPQQEQSNEERQMKDLNNRFTYHSPKADQPQRYQALREKAKELAILIVQSSKPSREQALALTKLQECSMWANAGIACNE